MIFAQYNNKPFLFLWHIFLRTKLVPFCAISQDFLPSLCSHPLCSPRGPPNPPECHPRLAQLPPHDLRAPARAEGQHQRLLAHPRVLLARHPLRYVGELDQLFLAWRLRLLKWNKKKKSLLVGSTKFINTCHKSLTKVQQLLFLWKEVFFKYLLRNTIYFYFYFFCSKKKKSKSKKKKKMCSSADI